MEEMISDIYSIPLAYILTYDTRIIRVSCQYAYQIYAYHTKIGNTRMYTSYEHAYVFHIYERAFRGTAYHKRASDEYEYCMGMI